MTDQHRVRGDDFPFTGFDFTDDTGTVSNPELRLRIQGQPDPTVLPITMAGNSGTVDLAGIQNVTGIQVWVTGDSGEMTPPASPPLGVYLVSAVATRSTAGTQVNPEACRYVVPLVSVAVKTVTAQSTIRITAEGQTKQFTNVPANSECCWNPDGLLNVNSINVAWAGGQTQQDVGGDSFYDATFQQDAAGDFKYQSGTPLTTPLPGGYPYHFSPTG